MGCVAFGSGGIDYRGLDLENPCRPSSAAGLTLTEWFQCTQGSGNGPQLRTFDSDLPEDFQTVLERWRSVKSAYDFSE